LTACVLDSGDGVTHTIPIIGGNLLNANLIERVNIAGRHVTTYLADLLLRRGYAFNSTADFETVREIKEKTCFVSCEIDLDRKLSKNTTCHLEEYRLPDTTLIKIEKERFEAPELLFNPMLGGFEMRGVHELVFDCIKVCKIMISLTIQRCPTDTRASLYGCVYLSGRVVRLRVIIYRWYYHVLWIPNKT
jgi:actin-related protein 2